MLEPNHTPYLVAEDEHVRVIFQPGQSDFLLITYGDRGTLADGLRFFADIPVRKLNISCIGFIAKSINWYPRISMVPLIEKVQEYIQKYSVVISYGGSMGGYAALKYSGLLRNTHVIALCPQWSIDRNECDSGDTTPDDFFEKEYHVGMGIRSSDCSGKVFVFFDQFDKIDSFHVKKICENMPANVFGVPRVGNNVTPVFSGTETFAKLIEHCRRDDSMSISLLVRESRRRSRVRTEKIFAFSRRRFPGLFVDLVKNIFRREIIPDVDLQYALIGMRGLSASREGARVGRIFDKYKMKFPDLPSMHFAALYVTQSSDLDVYLKTVHGTVVCYDVGKVDLVHKSLDQIMPADAILPVKMMIEGQSLRLFVKIQEYVLYISYAQKRVVVSYERERIAHINCEIFGSGFHLHCEGNYLSTEKLSGKIHCNRKEPHKFEIFSLGIG